MSRLQGKTIAVTGATRGLGHALAVELVAQGATVIGTGRNAERGRVMEGELRGNFAFYRADLSNSDDCSMFCANAVDEHGPPDVVINNAGINAVSSIIETTDESWDSIVDLNLRAPFQICRGFLPGMIDAGGGTFVHIASINAKIGVEKMAPYNAAKAGLVHFSNTLAVEHRAHGVASLAIILGGVDTDMAASVRRSIQPDSADQGGRPLGMPPHEIAAAIALLCRGEARLFTGSSIAIDGGISAGSLASAKIFGS